MCRVIVKPFSSESCYTCFNFLTAITADQNIQRFYSTPRSSKQALFLYPPPSSLLLFHSPSLWEASSFIKWLHFIALLSFLIICLLSQPAGNWLKEKSESWNCFKSFSSEPQDTPGTDSYTSHLLATFSHLFQALV